MNRLLRAIEAAWNGWINAQVERIRLEQDMQDAIERAALARAITAAKALAPDGFTDGDRAFLRELGVEA